MKYVSEIIGTDYIGWEGDTILLDCDCGTGKTYFVLNVLAKYAQLNKKKMIYIVNRTALFRQIFSEIVRLNLFDTVQVITYQRFISEDWGIDYYDYIIADEVHYILSDAWNDTTDKVYKQIFKAIKMENKTTVLMSATCKHIFNSIEANSGLFTNTKVTRYNVVRDWSNIDVCYYYEKDTIYNILDNILYDTENDDKIVVFCNSNKRLEMLKTMYAGFRPDILVSKSNKNIKCNNKHTIVKSDDLSTFNSRLLLTNKALDNGVDLKDRRIKHIITEVLDVDSMMQTLGRKRFIDDTDSCTFYIKAWNLKEIIPFTKQYNYQYEMGKAFLDRKNNMDKWLKFAQNRGKINQSNMIYFNENDEHKLNKLKFVSAKLNSARFNAMVNLYEEYNKTTKMYDVNGYIEIIQTELPNQLVDKMTPLINTEQCDNFLNFLQNYKDKPLYKKEQDEIQDMFEKCGIKTNGRLKANVRAYNGVLDDTYGDSFNYRFYNKDVKGKYYKNGMRNLVNGENNPNYDKRYWMLEDVSCR